MPVVFWDVLGRALYLLQERALKAKGIDGLIEVFGPDLDRVRAEHLINLWSGSASSWLPTFRFVETDILPSVGAYAEDKDTVYLDEGRWSRLSLDKQLLVLLEELGHAIETRLKPGQDTVGDEGHVFRNWVLYGTGWNPQQAELYKSDQISVLIDGELLNLEQYGENKIIDRTEITGVILPGDANKRDGIVQLSIANFDGTRFAGSGIYLGAGYILTNAHVVANFKDTERSTAYFGVTADPLSTEQGATYVYRSNIIDVFVYPSYSGDGDTGRDLAIVRVQDNVPTTIGTWEIKTPSDSTINDDYNLFLTYRADGLTDPSAQ